MSLKFDFNNMLQNALGQEGVSMEQLKECQDLALSAFDAIAEKRATPESRNDNMIDWMQSPYDQGEVVARVKAVAADIQQNFDAFVVLGIGGSALGPIAVFNALKHLYYNELPKEKRKTPKFYVVDNVDPDKMLNLFDVIDVDKTMFNVITKSGSTSETMSQYLIVSEMLKSRLGKDAAKHIIATTSQSKGNLTKLAQEEGYETFYIPEGVGGRFSELCPVGLLPAAVVGIDIDRDLRRERISRRLRERLEAGMVEEVRGLLEGSDGHAPVAPENLIYYGLEYKYLTMYVIGELSYDEMVRQLEIAIHQFAKRQMTWFRGMERRGIEIQWIDGTLPPEEKVSIVKKLYANFNNKRQ